MNGQADKQALCSSKGSTPADQQKAVRAAEGSETLMKGRSRAAQKEAASKGEEGSRAIAEGDELSDRTCSRVLAGHKLGIGLQEALRQELIMIGPVSTAVVHGEYGCPQHSSLGHKDAALVQPHVCIGLPHRDHPCGLHRTHTHTHTRLQRCADLRQAAMLMRITKEETSTGLNIDLIRCVQFAYQ